ncbi:MAG: DUF126 domain-containing protein [Pseudomonadota bacterium]
MSRLIKGHAGIGSGIVEGEALVAKDNFSARYDLDLKTGRFSRPSHKLYGESFSGRIIVLDIAKGGVASAWMLHVLMSGTHRPKALLLNSANPIMAQGASFGRMPLIDRFEDDVTTVIKTGDWLRLNPSAGTVEVV